LLINGYDSHKMNLISNSY